VKRGLLAQAQSFRCCKIAPGKFTDTRKHDTASVMQQRNNCRDEPTIRIAKAKAEKQKPGARPGFLRNISFRQLASPARVISSRH
jgi:hypothetical protein